jgi:hypothetical protein
MHDTCPAYLIFLDLITLISSKNLNKKKRIWKQYHDISLCSDQENVCKTLLWFSTCDEYHYQGHKVYTAQTSTMGSSETC